MKRFFARFVVVSTIALLADSSFADEKSWGDLAGRIRVVGKPQTRPGDESLLVDAKTSGLANVAIYLIERRDSKTPVHPSYERTAKSKVKLTMKNGRFDPHMLLIRTSQTMVQENRDGRAHNARIMFFSNTPM